MDQERSIEVTDDDARQRAIELCADKELSFRWRAPDDGVGSISSLGGSSQQAVFQPQDILKHLESRVTACEPFVRVHTWFAAVVPHLPAGSKWHIKLEYVYRIGFRELWGRVIIWRFGRFYDTPDDE